MKFTVDFSKAPTLPSILLVIGFGCCAFLAIGLVVHFIYWELPSWSYFRAAFAAVTTLLIGAYFNNKHPQKNN